MNIELLTKVLNTLFIFIVAVFISTNSSAAVTVTLSLDSNCTFIAPGGTTSSTHSCPSQAIDSYRSTNDTSSNTGSFDYSFCSFSKEIETVVLEDRGSCDGIDAALVPGGGGSYANQFQNFESMQEEVFAQHEGACAAIPLESAYDDRGTAFVSSVISCKVIPEPEPEPEPIGEWSDFSDSAVVRACDANCTQEIKQTRECIGGELGSPNCIGETTQTVERSCSPGQGLCPINAETVGRITKNPLIKAGSAEASAGAALENLCPQLGFGDQNLTPAQQDLVARCNNIILETDNARQLNSVQSIIADEVASQAVNVRRVSLAQLSNVASRLAAMRPALARSSKTLSYNKPLSHPLPGYAGVSRAKQLYQAEQDQRGGWEVNKKRGGAAGDKELPEANGRWGVFISGLYGRGDRASSNRASGFDFDSHNITIGADYLLNQSTIIGLALGYGSSGSNFSNDGGSLENDTTTVSLYGSHYFKNSWFLDGVIGYGSSDYTNYRNIRYVADNVGVSQTALSKPQGDQLLYSLGVGKTITAKSEIDWDFSLRANYLDATIDRFSEVTLNATNPGFGLALEIDEQNVTSFTSELSLSVSKAFSQNFGVVVPSFGLSWLHEFEDGSDNLRARFVNDPFSVNFIQSGLDVAGGGLPTIFEVAVDSNDSNYGRAQLGVNVLFPNDWSASFLINKTLGLENIDYEYYNINLRKVF